MHIENELKKMTSRMFGGGLTDTILEAYRQEQEETGFGEEEAAYQAGKAALAAGLGQAEQEDWKQAEALYTQCLELILRFGFPRGVYGAFQQCFTTEAPRDLFHTLVEQEIRPSGRALAELQPGIQGKAEPGGPSAGSSAVAGPAGTAAPSGDHVRHLAATAI